MQHFDIWDFKIFGVMHFAQCEREYGGLERRWEAARGRKWKVGNKK